MIVDHTIKIKERMNHIVANEVTRKMMFDDYVYVFQALGLSDKVAKEISLRCIEIIKNSDTLQAAEGEMKKLFKNTRAGDKNIFDLIGSGLDERFEKIAEQLTPHIRDVKGKVFDYGMGAGGVAQILKDRLGLEVEGGDVRDFRSKNITVPFVRLSSFSGKDGRIVPVPDRYYETAVLTNVIHHEEVNENILKELNRITSRKLVIIETVPVGKTPQEIALDRERTFAGDVLWNRFFNYADIPVPGTYETPEDWIKRFEKYGWKTTHSEGLGFDQKTIHDVHHLLVFER